MKRWLDLPPVWLALGILLTYGLDRLVPGLATGWITMRVVGAGLVLAGFGLMLLGAVELIRQRTTFIPRRDPSALAQGGIYRLSRNPIYLGDVLVLAGFILWWDVWPALVLVPLFMWIITIRFIKGEERRLIKTFGEDAREWFAQTRRWL
ncbi:methyltransferase family protein [Maritimibacter fusiformis]|uniref:Isoprenylcysteine carboxylmethyltransferase family protein n=1 Tax=Maritimibacter fusiformis TaxID=2603819 RepID=A0A5D0RIJ4_9RHOB|nr:isoprenylcysteine carboxylmethyltransferase family protein [Maritimibacter fusiformis]TYB80909.1 isoprenylcysteine carboxylmethyltransferase family protein [Maritimibacter fusiformis]